MNTSLRILVVGFGSIGRRHYQNLLHLGFKDVSVYDIDIKKIAGEKISFVAKLRQATFNEFDVVVVCSPSDKHITIAHMAVLAGCHVFIEKPLSNNLRGVKELVHEARKKKVVVMVACNFRFHAGFHNLERLLASQKIGKPLSACVIGGHDLSRSRAGVDYRTTYAADKKKGGVVLDSCAHIVEYLSALFGDVVSVVARYGNVSTLDILSEDYATGILHHKGGVVSVFYSDYFSKPKRHILEVQCEKGWAKWDFANNTFEWYSAEKDEYNREMVYIRESPSFMRNDMYLKEIIYFLTLLKGKKKPIQDLSRAEQIMRVLLAIKRSGRIGKRVKL